MDDEDRESGSISCSISPFDIVRCRINFMVTAIRQHVKVKENGMIEIKSAELVAGSNAEVIVLLDTPEPKTASCGLTQFIGAGRGLYADLADIDKFISDERDEWER